MGTFTINDIYAQLNKHYLIKAHHYEVRIYGGTDPSTDADPEIMINCSAINVPGSNVSFNGFKKYGIGHIKNVPVGRSFTELNLTFYETDGEPERKYFTNWQDRIYNTNTNRFAFYQDIVKTVSIIQYDKKGNKTYECQVLEAWPSNVSPLDKGYSNEGVPQFNVNLQFYKLNEIFYDKVEGQRPTSIFNI